MKKLKLDSDEVHVPTYAARAFSARCRSSSCRAGHDARAAYQLVHDELELDGNPALNLASFVTSWMEPEADRLAAETQPRTSIDQDEYPQTEVIAPGASSR